MVFKPGQSGNPAGREPYSKVIGRMKPEDFKTAGDVRGLDLVASIAAFAETPLQLKAQCGSILAQYQEPKPVRKISRPFDLPVSQSVEEATAAIAKIGTLAAAGAIGLDEAGDLVRFQEAYVQSLTDTDTEREVAEWRATLEKILTTGDYGVRVRAGLPALPGTNIIGLATDNGGDGE
jgi:hypothetical protein